MEETNELKNILDERKSRYGEFYEHARLSQQLKSVMWNKNNAPDKLTYSMQEALEMIAHKIARILNGDPTYVDSWIDIAGYAQLIVNELNQERV